MLEDYATWATRQQKAVKTEWAAYAGVAMLLIVCAFLVYGR